MEYTRLGDTGLKISRLALGCMSYGDPTTEGAHRWALADDEAQPFFRQAIELGITFWDTANVYQAGTSEEVVGRAIRRYSRREDIVLATKVFGKMHDGPGGSGLSRKAIMEQIDASLTRLGTDYVDLYQIHRFDPATRGVTMAQVALAWVLHNPAVSAPIVGATKPHHLPEAAAALELKLTGEEAADLEKPYTNHGPSWY
jgi:aryl-alcohol dehydrogenase-like predicted oxidoreductase